MDSQQVMEHVRTFSPILVQDVTHVIGAAIEHYAHWGRFGIRLENFMMSVVMYWSFVEC